MWKIKFLLVLATFVIVGCKTDTKDNQEDDMPKEFKEEHNAKLSLDYVGVYEGQLPCADCEFIRTKISLNEDKTYYSKSIYVGKSDAVIEEYGSYKWQENKNVLELTSKDQSHKIQYKVGENWLLMLNQQGEEFDSSFKEMYYLKKV